MRIERIIPKGPTVKLFLTDEEAIILATMMANVAGRKRGPRGVADAVLNNLRTVGIEADHFKYPVRDCIQFED